MKSELLHLKTIRGRDGERSAQQNYRPDDTRHMLIHRFLTLPAPLDQFIKRLQNLALQNPLAFSFGFVRKQLTLKFIDGAIPFVHDLTTPLSRPSLLDDEPRVV